MIDQHLAELFNAGLVWENIGLFTLGVVICVVFTLAWKPIVFKLAKCNNCKIKKFEKGEKFQKYVSWIFSLDYCCTYNHKKMMCKKTADEPSGAECLKKYISTSNSANLLGSTFLVVILLIMFICCKGCGKCIALGMLTFRIYSRVNEVSISFVKDMIDKEQQSGLTSKERIVLAMKSLLEETLLFGALYACLAVNTDASASQVVNAFLKGFYSIVPSISVCCDVSISVISVYQSVSAMLLISLAIASYISNSNLDKKKASSDNAKTDVDNQEEIPPQNTEKDS